MQKLIIGTTAAVAIMALLTAGTLGSQHEKKEAGKDAAMTHGRGMKGSGCPGMRGGSKGMGMMGMGGMGMGGRTILPTEDGGVVVATCNMLLKYDENLELVKKTTIDISESDMRQMMETMKSRRSMMQEMMDGEMMPGGMMHGRMKHGEMMQDDAEE
jgi:hypothetical protein